MSASLIRCVHDTFLQMLADNLPGLTIKELRYDSTDATAATIQVNALNVHFLKRGFHNQPTYSSVAIDVVYDNELTALDVEQQIASMFQICAWTALMNYTDPSNPVPVGNRKISWYCEVYFRPVVADTYYQSTATIKLTY